MALSRTSRWVLVAVGVVVVLVGAFLYVRSMPAVSEAELAEAQRVLDERAGELAAWTPPPRETFGDAEPADQASFDRFFTDPRWTDCFDGASAEGFFTDATDPASGAIYGYAIDRGEDEERPPETERATYLMAYGPPGISNAIREVETACEGLGEAVERFAATPDLRSPFRVVAGGVVDADVHLIKAVKAIATVARQRAREEGMAAGLQLLARGVLVIRDTRKGPVGVFTAMLSVAAEGVLLSHMTGLVLADPAMDTADYEELYRTLAASREARVDAGRMLLADRYGMLQEASGDADVIGFTTVIAAEANLDLCAGETVAECMVSIEAEPSVPEPDEGWDELLGARLASNMSRDYFEWLMSSGHRRYLARILEADTGNQGVEILLRLVEARSAGEEGDCPPAIDAAHLRTPHSDDPFVVQPYIGDLHEIIAPDLRVGEFSRPVVKFGCPAAVANWALADGTEMPPPGGEFAMPSDPPLEPEAPEADPE